MPAITCNRQPLPLRLFFDMLGGMALKVFVHCPDKGAWDEVYVAEQPAAIVGIMLKYRCPHCGAEHAFVVSGYEKTKNIPPKSILAVRSL